MIQILSRVPGETTMFETDDPVAAVQRVTEIDADPVAVLISIDHTEV